MKGRRAEAVITVIGAGLAVLGVLPTEVVDKDGHWGLATEF